MVIKTNKESGFSLIEVSIALIVISLLMTPIIYAYNIHMETKRSIITAGRTDAISSALVKFYEKNGFYPIPAQPNIAQGVARTVTTPGFGEPATMPIAGWPACTATSAVVCRAANPGTFGVAGTGTPPIPTTDGILIGSVPISALGLQFKAMIDGYGNRLTYAVSQNLTTTANFRDNRGSIRVRNLAGTNSQAHFVIISHGKSRIGAFTLGGARTIACNTATAPIPADSENCNNDGTFRGNEDNSGKSRISEAVNVNFFDDVIAYRNTTALGLWSYIPNTTLDMQTQATGNLKIGCPTTGACEPVAKLDVEGNVRATEVRTTRICDTSESRCVSTWTNTLSLIAPRNDANPIGWFSPDMLTGAPAAPPPVSTYDSAREGFVGSGIRCYSDYALRGIRDYDEFCAGQTASPHFAATTVTNCPSGQFATGITILGANSFRFDCVVP
jgi:prepilin-type N-terminal cleavage/methylation domain-containing protein